MNDYEQEVFGFYQENDQHEHKSRLWAALKHMKADFERKLNG